MISLCGWCKLHKERNPVYFKIAFVHSDIVLKCVILLIIDTVLKCVIQVFVQWSVRYCDMIRSGVCSF